jgi:cell division protein FtsW (lipid II flippase)
LVSTGVTVLGLGLVLANSITGSTLKDIGSAVQDHTKGGSVSSNAHHALVALAAQVLFILVLAFLADWNPDLGTVIVALLLGLWMVWAIKNVDQITKLSHVFGIGQ